MAKRFGVAIGGKVKVFATKRSYLWWAVSTRDGWKHFLLHLAYYGFLRPVVRVLIAVQQFMRKQKQFENNCPVMVETADGIPARCMFYMADGKTCPRHGDVR